MKQTIQRINEMEQCSRDYIQDACKGFRKVDCNVALLWAPRVGKTRGALNILNGESVLVVSNTEIIRDNWKEALQNYGGDWKSICYQSLKNELKDIWQVIIYDESDLISDNYAEIAKCLNPDRMIFLTGTETFRSVGIMEELCKSNGKDLWKWNINFQKAIDWGILPVPSITCIGMKLRDDKLKRDQLFMIGKDKKKETQYAKYGDHFKFLKGRAKNLGVQCTEVEWYSLIDYEIERWKAVVKDYGVTPTPIPYVLCLNKLKQAGLERKNFLADKKNRYIQRLIKFLNVENERVIIFANSIPQAEFITEEHVIHSKIKTKKGEKNAVERFNSGETKLLVSVGQLERGVSLYDIHTSIILQIPASDASALQKASRNLLDDTPRLVLAYFRDTKDEENVKKFVSQFKSDYVTWLNVANT